MIKSIWGENFNIEETQIKNKSILNKINKPKIISHTVDDLKSKKISIRDRLDIIATNVYKILGKQKENT